VVLICKGIHSAPKNEILSFAEKWMKLENTILSEVSQVQKAKSHMFSLYADCRPNTNVQHYEKQDMPRGGHIREGEGKRRLM
jgi:hypothetical protein